VDASPASPRARSRLRLAAAFLGLVCTAAAAGSAGAQAGPGPALTSLALPAVLPDEVLRPPLVRALSRVFHPAGDPRFVSSAARSSLAAYAAYRDALRERARDVGRGPFAARRAPAPGSGGASGLDDLLTDLPGGELVQHGRTLLRRLDASTRLGLEGYRLQLRVGDALDGRLSIRAEKRLP
jgi:hypothetical protein